MSRNFNINRLSLRLTLPNPGAGRLFSSESLFLSLSVRIFTCFLAMATANAFAQESVPRANEESSQVRRLAEVHLYMFETADFLDGTPLDRWLSGETYLAATKLDVAPDWGPKHPRWDVVVEKIRTDQKTLVADVRRSRIQSAMLQLPSDRLVRAFGSKLQPSQLAQLLTYYYSTEGQEALRVIKQLENIFGRPGEANFSDTTPSAVLERRAKLFDLSMRAQFLADEFREARRQSVDRSTVGSASASIGAFFGLVVVAHGEALDRLDREISNQLRERHLAFCATELASLERAIVMREVNAYQSQIVDAARDFRARSQELRAGWQAFAVNGK